MVLQGEVSLCLGVKVLSPDMPERLKEAFRPIEPFFGPLVYVVSWGQVALCLAVGARRETCRDGWRRRV